MPRPPKKKVAAVAEAQEIGKLKAQRRAKKWKIPIQERILDYLEGFIQRIDPLEAAAIIGGTIWVHEAIFQLEAFSGTVATIIKTGVLRDPVGTLLDYLFKTGQFKPEATTEEQQAKAQLTKHEMLSWLLAFAISYWAFKHGDDLLAVANSFIGKSLTPTPT